MVSFLSCNLVENNLTNTLVILQYAEKDLRLKTEFVSAGKSLALS